MSPVDGTLRLLQLRKILAASERWGGIIDAIIIPSEDAHQSEYVAQAFQRRAYISGFDGSSGCAVVTSSKAALWTDGRYYAQAEQQLDKNWLLMKQGLRETPSEEEWLCKVLPAKARVAVDPFLVTYRRFKEIRKTLKQHGHILLPIFSNPIDEIWSDRPPLPRSRVFPLDIKYTGLRSQDKIVQMRKALRSTDTAALLLTALDEVAWLLNLRGNDVDYNPVFYAYVIVTENTVRLYVDKDRLTEETMEYLAGINVFQYDQIKRDIERLLPNKEKIWIGENCNYGLVHSLDKNQLHIEITPAAKLKAVKNKVELSGAKSAQTRDSAAVCSFLAWLESRALKECPNLNEHTAADKLEAFRRQQPNFMGLSFPTICGYGPNGAIIHYRATSESAATIEHSSLLLIDSGAQYLDGTTDVTRTVHLGIPTEYERECFTLVLKGHINLAQSIFPKSTTGHALDVQARVALWQQGLDYRHGTGHGVGAFLNVHEGPQMITMKALRGNYPLEEHMLISNEPGYYEDGQFGIRIENVIAVTKANTKYQFGGEQYLTFETLTLVPIQKKMINTNMLNESEIGWVDQYHAEIRKQILPLLIEQDHQFAVSWLDEATKPLQQSCERETN